VAPIAIGAILLLLYMLFNSLRDSLLTLAGIPFSAAGGLIALYVSGLNLSISAAIGFVSLFGVSVMNGILILTYFNHLVAEGKEPSEAMRYAAQQQMRPMLMMALSACCRPRSPPASAARCNGRLPRSWSAACCSARSCCWWSRRPCR